MVSVSTRARNDLKKIMTGLLRWEKIELSEDFVRNYINEILDVCYDVEKLSFHADSVYQNHKKFGKNVYKYKRNKETTWYIIYDFDKKDNILIKKILSNHITKI